MSRRSVMHRCFDLSNRRPRNLGLLAGIFGCFCPRLVPASWLATSPISRIGTARAVDLNRFLQLSLGRTRSAMLTGRHPVGQYRNSDTDSYGSQVICCPDTSHWNWCRSTKCGRDNSTPGNRPQEPSTEQRRKHHHQRRFLFPPSPFR